MCTMIRKKVGSVKMVIRSFHEMFGQLLQIENFLLSQRRFISKDNTISFRLEVYKND